MAKEVTITITGLGRSGKTTIALALINALISAEFDLEQITFIDEGKEDLIAYTQEDLDKRLDQLQALDLKVNIKTINTFNSFMKGQPII